MKILSIGNSFSEDAHAYLADIFNAYGERDFLLCNLLIGGCTLERHSGNVRENRAEYHRVIQDGKTRTASEKVTIAETLRMADWDYITLQQASGLSGVRSSYEPYLSELTAYLQKEAPGAKLAWHMTWAYDSASDHPEFSNYARNQQVMFRAILSACREIVLPSGAFDRVIPSGASIQKCREAFAPDGLTRDGFHLSERGRLIAGYTWYASLTGNELTDLPFLPEKFGFSPDDAYKIADAINQSLSKDSL